MSAGHGGLEKSVQDSYLVYLPKQPQASAEEASKQYSKLIQKAEGLQEQYGAEKFHCYRKFEFVRGIAAVIKDDSLVELLKKEGYAVEKQAQIRADAP